MDFVRGRRYLVTGAIGFIAQETIKQLCENDAVVFSTVRSKKPFKIMNSQCMQNLSGVTLYECDMRDEKKLREIITQNDIDSVIHLAACSIVRQSARDIRTAVETNVMGTLNVLEACKAAEVETVVVSTSDKAYGAVKEEDLPYREHKNALQGLDPYSASKSCQDIICQMYARAGDMQVRVIRSVNVYGPGDFSLSRIVPGTILRVLNGIPPVIRQTETKRQYIYSYDAANAFIQASKPDVFLFGNSFGDISFNVNSRYDSVRTAEEMICEIMSLMETNLVPDIIESNTDELPNQFVDSSKFKSTFDWEPKYDIVSGLNNTIEWYRQIDYGFFKNHFRRK